ncbi:MAG: hypothetical protein PF450_06560 [Bacteroidales bacterium]|jgi:hypothetical protein|nr:hypothetical protein [Bacteroidales bacterium]
MSQNKTFTQETLERVRSGKEPDSHKKKRKLSRTVIIVDAVIVLLIFIFIYRDSKSPDFHSTSLEYKNCRIRYSINRDNTYKDYHFSLQIKGLSDLTNFKVNKSFATVILMIKDKEITRFNLGNKINNLKIKKGMIQSYSFTLDIFLFSKIIPIFK